MFNGNKFKLGRFAPNCSGGAGSRRGTTTEAFKADAVFAEHPIAGG
jgi:hypothetical protein